jgi:hypothetical protein
MLTGERPGSYQIGNLPGGFNAPKYPIVVPTMGTGYYSLSFDTIQQPYNLEIRTDRGIWFTIDESSCQDWVWVNSRIDMLRYF